MGLAVIVYLGLPHVVVLSFLGMSNLPHIGIVR